MRTETEGDEGLLAVEAALDRLLAQVPSELPTERVALAAGLGRVLAEAVTSTTDLPPWDNSAMDGYAIRARDVAAASEDAPVRLTVVGEVRAGHAPDTAVGEGTAVRVATGAPLPPGADAVVQVELTTPLDEGGERGPRGRDAAGPLPAACLVHRSIGPGTAVRRRGEDLRAGQRLLEPGGALRPADIAVAAAGGAPELLVRRRPRVAVLATGDELRVPGSGLGPAGIPDSNRPGLLALAATVGAETLDLGIAEDTLEATLAALRDGLASADAIVVSGGVSVGPYDVVRTAFGQLGRVDLWRVAVQPGKPFAFGVAPAPPGAEAPDGRVLLFGLPGNPVSAFVTFELFVRPALDRLAGRATAPPAGDAGVIDEPVRKAPGRRAFLRVVADRDAYGRLRRDGRGRVHVRLAGGQGSHLLHSLVAADALAVVPETVDHLEAGSDVELRWLDPPAGHPS